MKPLSRLLIIGADSADPDLIEKWGAAGDLPNLMQLRACGAFGRVRNPVACDAGAAWPTFHSGLEPGNQPQFDGGRYFDPLDYKVKFHPPEVAAPAIWDELSRAGKRCFVMDAPYAKLARNLSGISIVDWGTHNSTVGDGKMCFSASPITVVDEVLSLVGPDPAGGRACDDYWPATPADCRRFLALHLDRIRKKTTLIKHFLAQGRWDYFEAVYGDLHCVGHHLWHINDPTHPRYRATAETALGEPLRTCYKALDQGIGEILTMVDDRTLIVFYASHGIGPQYTGTSLLDRILYNLEHGIHSKRKNPSLKKRLRALWRAAPRDLRLALMPLRNRFRGALGHSLFLPHPETRKFFEVFCTNGTGGVRINLRGRESHGLVDPSDYGVLLDRVSSDLSKIVNVETGEPLIDQIVRLQEIFPGPYASQLPDLGLVWNRKHPIRYVSSPQIGTLAQEHVDGRSGDHRQEGLFLAAGHGVRGGGLNKVVEAADFAPTIRRIFGLPPQACDGKPIDALSAGPLF